MPQKFQSMLRAESVWKISSQILCGLPHRFGTEHRCGREVGTDTKYEVAIDWPASGDRWPPKRAKGAKVGLPRHLGNQAPRGSKPATAKSKHDLHNPWVS